MIRERVTNELRWSSLPLGTAAVAASDAADAIRMLSAVWGSAWYRRLRDGKRNARKRTPKYLAKGGVRK